MNYLLRSRSKNEYKIKGIAIAVVFILLIFLSVVFPTGTKNFFQTIARPMWSVGDGLKNIFGNTYNFLSIQSNLVAKNKNLEDQIGLLSLKVIDYDTIQKQNQDLKSMLGRKEVSDKILSRVLSAPPQSPYDTLVIDVGSSDGINLGSRVYISDNVIIGSITNVTPHTALVELFSKGDKKMQAILERTGTSYEISGRGGANLSIEAPNDADILWGDTFTYPGLTPSVIGSVYYIDTNSQSAFKTVFIRIPGNVFQTKWVFVSKGV